MRAAVRVVLAMSALAARDALAQHGLSPVQRDSLDRGGTLYHAEPRDGSPWPAVTVRTFIRASPDVSVATFMDWESHVRTLPSVTRSRISRVVSPSVTEVDYTLQVPVVSDEDYTVRNTVSRDARGGYRVDWVLVRASSTQATVGHASFLPFRDGTLLEYENFVTPGSRVAGMSIIRNRALERVRQTALALARQVEAERSDSALTRARLATLRAALATP